MIEEKITPVGEITITDLESGEVVYTGHNMIVNEGRKIIYDAVFNSANFNFKNFYPYFEFVGSTANSNGPDVKFSEVYENIIILSSESKDITAQSPALDRQFNFILSSYFTAPFNATMPIIKQIGLIASTSDSVISTTDVVDNTIYVKADPSKIINDKYTISTAANGTLALDNSVYVRKNNITGTKYKATKVTGDTNPSETYYQRITAKKFNLNQITNKFSDDTTMDDYRLFSRAPIDQFYLRNGRTYKVSYLIKF